MKVKAHSTQKAKPLATMLAQSQQPSEPTLGHLCANSGVVSSSIDIQTSIRDWNHPVFHAGLLLPEVAISSNLSHRRLVLLL